MTARGLWIAALLFIARSWVERACLLLVHAYSRQAGFRPLDLLTSSRSCYTKSPEMKAGLGFSANGVGLPPKPNNLTGLSSGEQQPFQSNGHSKACALCKGKNPAWTVETCFAKRHCPSGCGNQALAKRTNDAGTLFKRAPCNTCATAARKKRTERNKNEQHQHTKKEIAYAPRHREPLERLDYGFHTVDTFRLAVRFRKLALRPKAAVRTQFREGRPTSHFSSPAVP